MIKVVSNLFRDQAIVREQTEVKDRSKQLGRKTDIARSFEERVRNIDISYLEAKGQPALWGTNEAVDIEDFNNARNGGTPPNGYLTGVGWGAGFVCLEAFPVDELPTAVIMGDLDPRVVLMGKAAIKALREFKTDQEFWQGYFDYRNLWRFIREVQEEDKELAEAIPHKDLVRVAQGIIFPWGNHELSRVKVGSYSDKELYSNYFKLINVIGVFLKHYPKLRNLALEGNLAIVKADFTNSDFVYAVTQLPDYKTERNVVYLSNIADHVSRSVQGGEMIQKD